MHAELATPQRQRRTRHVRGTDAYNDANNARAAAFDLHRLWINDSG